MAEDLGLNRFVATTAFLMTGALGLNRFVATTAFLMAGALGLNWFREVYAVCYPSSYLTVMLGFCTWTRSAINGAR